MRNSKAEYGRRYVLRGGIGLFAGATSSPFARKAAAEVPSDLMSALAGRGLALLIGVSAYEDTNWPRLPQVMTEVDLLADGLQPHFDQVFTLKDPTSSDLRAKLRHFLLGRANVSDERVFIFYAGHGFTDFNQNAGRTSGYITGIDTPSYNPDSPQVDQAIAFEEIDALNRQTRARHVLMVFDSCFAGSLFLTRGAVQHTEYDYGRLRVLNDQPSRYYITTGDETNEIPADSPMADLLLRGINGQADLDGSGYVTEEDLALFLKRNIPRYSRRPLNPLSGGIADAHLSQGKFIFLTGITQQRVAPDNSGPKSDLIIPHPSRVFIVFFDYNSSTLANRGRQIVAEAAAAYKRLESNGIEVNGYTDMAHTDEEAFALSQAEANEVVRYLIIDGVPKNAIKSRAYGKSKPLVPTLDGIREPQNRRVEIIIK